MSRQDLPDKKSRWVLSTAQTPIESLLQAANMKSLEFSWIARDLTPIPLNKIHWVSEEGLKNRGAVSE